MIPLNGAGLVMRRVKRGEDDLRLTVFMHDVGKILVLSKGGQRPGFKLRSLQEPFTEADFHLFVPPDNGVNGRLAGGKLMDSHQGLRANYEAFETAARITETVDVLVPFRAPAPDVYDILRTALRALSAGQPPLEEWVLFVARLLGCLGHGDVSERLQTLLHSRTESLDRCRTLVDAELEQILPWRLKSDRAALETSKEMPT